MNPQKALMVLIGAWMFELMFFGWLIALSGFLGWVVPEAFFMLLTAFVVGGTTRNAN